MSITPAFTGSSAFSSSFQQVIQRAVAIATLPITQLTQGKQKLQDQATALGTLESKFSSVDAAIQNLASVTGSGSLSASVADSSIATATAGSAATVGSYTIQVTDIGSASSALSSGTLPRVADPSASGISSAATLTLTINGVNTTIQPADTKLNSLAAAINGANAGVQATIINLGAPSSPDYRLSLQSSTLGNTSIALSDGSSLLNAVTTGTPAVYTVNGQPSGGISSNTRAITVAPGLTVNLKAVGSTQVSVTRSTAGLSSALSSFVTSYNAAVTGLDAQRGQNAGPLAGQSIIYTLSSLLTNIATYSSGSSGIASLSDLGVTFDKNGVLRFDSTVVANFTDTQFQQASTFLGTTTGSGFLASAAAALNSVDNATDGTFQISLNGIQSGLTNQQNLIDANQRRVDDLQANLEAQLNAADALIASLEQQVNYMNALFSANQAQQNGR